MRFALALVCLACQLAGGCHREPTPNHAQAGDLPPLPPASGTPVGYLIDARGDLKLRDDQLAKLKDIDSSLAAKDAEIDTQLRQIEKPQEEEEPPQRGGGGRPHHHNNAPGASGRPTGDAAKLHQLRAGNDRDALRQAWALLDPDQQKSAQHLLEDRGVEVPGAPRKQQEQNGEDGTPVPGLEEP
jgi:hypothetical protein